MVKLIKKEGHSRPRLRETSPQATGMSLVGALWSKLIPRSFVRLWPLVAGQLAQSLAAEGTAGAAFLIKGLVGWQGLSSAT